MLEDGDVSGFWAILFIYSGAHKGVLFTRSASKHLQRYVRPVRRAIGHVNGLLRG